MIGGKQDGSGEGNIESRFLPSDRTLSARPLVGDFVDSILDRIVRGETGAERGHAEIQVPGRRVAVGEFDIRGGVYPCGDSGSSRDVGVGREDPVNLHPDFADSRRTGVRDETGEGCAGNRGCRTENEIIGRLGFHLAGTVGTGDGGHPAVGIAGAEEEWKSRGGSRSEESAA